MRESRIEKIGQGIWSAAVIGLLEGKFKEVPPSVRKRIRRAKVSTLKLWFARAYIAPDLPSVFDTALDVLGLEFLAKLLSFNKDESRPTPDEVPNISVNHTTR